MKRALSGWGPHGSRGGSEQFFDTFQEGKGLHGLYWGHHAPGVGRSSHKQPCRLTTKLRKMPFPDGNRLVPRQDDAGTALSVDKDLHGLFQPEVADCSVHRFRNRRAAPEPLPSDGALDFRLVIRKEGYSETGQVVEKV
jgi:hypothetical protein